MKKMYPVAANINPTQVVDSLEKTGKNFRHKKTLRILKQICLKQDHNFFSIVVAKDIICEIKSLFLIRYLA